jgi:hypothetical protein
LVKEPSNIFPTLTYRPPHFKINGWFDSNLSRYV